MGRERSERVVYPCGQAESSESLPFSLDKRTYLDTLNNPITQKRVTATLRVYSDDLAEVGWSVVVPSQKRSARGKSPNQEENKERCSRRAKATVRRKAMAMRADRMLTLTYRDNQENIEMAWEHFSKFTRAMRKEYVSFPHIVIPERQKRGAIHFHIALNKFYPVDALRRIWQSVVGSGNIDIQKRKTKDTVKIASYMTKYLTKTFNDPNELLAQLGAHRFRTSLGIHIVTMVKTFTGDDISHRILLWLNETSGSIGFIWKKEDHYDCGWACSWG